MRRGKGGGGRRRGGVGEEREGGGDKGELLEKNELNGRPGREYR